MYLFGQGDRQFVEGGETAQLLDGIGEADDGVIPFLRNDGL